MNTYTEIETIEQCRELWQQLESVRNERNRNIRYKNGYHWSEYVDDPERKGYRIREEELIAREGRIPLKHNFINQFIRNILGHILQHPTQSIVHTRTRDNQQMGEVLSNTLQACLKLNRSSTLDVATAEELLLTGFACTKVRYGYYSEKDRCDGEISNVDFNSLFFNYDFNDSRFRELRIIGEIHDMTPEEILLHFAKNRKEEQWLRELLQQQTATIPTVEEKHTAKDFTTCGEKGKHRIIEVWQKKGRWVRHYHDYSQGTEYLSADFSEAPEEGDGIVVREIYQHYWEVTYLTATGVVLKKEESPFAHGSHPYVLSATGLTNGEIKSTIGDLIDIQRYINRLIVMIDFIIGSSAKGVLMVPENAIPDGYSIADFTNEYVKTNGVIVYKPNNTRDIPFQITSNSTNVGAWEMLNMQMQLIQQISGVSAAAQGFTPRNNTPASLYAQETQNSLTNYQVLFDTLNEHKRQRDEKLLRVLLQFYREERSVSFQHSLAGRYHTEIFSPEQAEQVIDFDLAIGVSAETPVYRELFDTILMDMLKSGLIDMELFLSNSALPFSDKLLNQLKEKAEIAKK